MPSSFTVLHCTSNLMSGGAEATLNSIVCRSTSRGVRHVVASMISGGIFADKLEAHGVAVHGFDAQRSWAAFHLLEKFVKLVRVVKPDVIQAWNYHANFLSTVTAPFFGKGIPVIWNVRQTLPSIRNEGLRTQLTILSSVPLSRHPRAIVYNSVKAAADHESLRYASRNRRIIFNGFDLTRFRPDLDRRASVRRSLGLPSDSLILGRVARFHPMKDFSTLFEVFSRVAAADSRVHLVLVGRDVGPENPKIAELLSRCAAPSRVHFLGETSNVEYIVPAFDCAVSTSAWGEAFPNVLAEAMACAVPAVATDVGESATIIGDDARIAPPRDVQALSAHVLDILALSEQQRMQLGERDRRHVATTFDLDNVTRQYEDLWRASAAAR